jgi:uroporphyrinogen-III decarboxylase
MCLDILTPLPAMGIDFTIIENKGPKIVNPIAGASDVDAIKPLHDIDTQVPFLGPILKVNQMQTILKKYNV